MCVHVCVCVRGVCECVCVFTCVCMYAHTSVVLYSNVIAMLMKWFLV